MKSLTIPSNEQLFFWGTLTQAKHRQKQKMFLAEGSKVVKEMLKSTAITPIAMLVLESKADKHENLFQELHENVPIYKLSNQQWCHFSQDKESEGIIGIAKGLAAKNIDEVINDDNNSRLLLLHEINNPNNLGAIMRSAMWFGFNTIILSKASVDVTNPKVIRTSMGAIFHLTIIEQADLLTVIEKVKTHYLVVATTPSSGCAPHSSAGKTALILGNETHGLPEQISALAHERWHIAGTQTVDSLSLPQASAILMYECAKQKEGN
ncbi:MAG: RNA methyltransferase [Deltaproteobacteria bacterium]